MTKGFTLIETLVAITILGVVGFVIANILTHTFQGNNKTTLLGNVKQNGDTALNIMTGTFRTADQIICVTSFANGTLSTTGDTIITEKNGIYTRFRFYAATSRSNGYIAEDNPTVTDPNSIFSPPPSDPNSVPLCNPTSAQVNPAILTDIDPQSGVSVTNGTFTENVAPGYKDSVTIQFNIGPGVSAATTFDQQLGSSTIPYETTVSLR